MQRNRILPRPRCVAQVKCCSLFLCDNLQERSLVLLLLRLVLLSRDLKPHNLLMDPKTMKLKIADLGLARAFTLPMKKYTHEVNKSMLRKAQNTHCFLYCPCIVILICLSSMCCVYLQFFVFNRLFIATDIDSMV